MGYDRDNALAQALAQIEQNRIVAQQSENQFGANYNLNAWQAQQNQEYQQQQLAYEKAMNELNLFGRIMTQEAANAVGLPVGTTLAKYNASGGSRRSSSGGGGGGIDIDWSLDDDGDDGADKPPVQSPWQPMRNAISSLLEEAQRRKNATGGGR